MFFCKKRYSCLLCELDSSGQPVDSRSIEVAEYCMIHKVHRTSCIRMMAYLDIDLVQLDDGHWLTSTTPSVKAKDKLYDLYHLSPLVGVGV